MATIFDLQLTQASESIHISLSVLPDPENVDIAVGILLLSRIHELKWSLFRIYFRLMAAIFDLRLTQTSESIHTNFSVLSDPKNVGIAIEILLLSCVSAEFCVTECLQPPSKISDFSLLTHCYLSPL